MPSVFQEEQNGEQNGEQNWLQAMAVSSASVALHR